MRHVNNTSGLSPEQRLQAVAALLAKAVLRSRRTSAPDDASARPNLGDPARNSLEVSGHPSLTVHAG